MMSLASGVNQLLETFSEIIEAVRQESRNALGSSSEIASGNEDLAHRTEQQAASLEQTAATTEQLAASVKSSALSSRQAAQLAAEATGVAQAGGERGQERRRPWAASSMPPARSPTSPR